MYYIYTKPRPKWSLQQYIIQKTFMDLKKQGPTRLDNQVHLSLPNRTLYKNYNQKIQKRTNTNIYRYLIGITSITNFIPLLYI